MIAYWVYFNKIANREMKSVEKWLTTLLCAKSFTDTTFFFHIIACKPFGALEGLDAFFSHLRGLTRPVFEGILIYVLLAMSLGRWIYRSNLPSCSGGIASCLAFMGALCFAMNYSLSLTHTRSASQVKFKF